MKLQIMSSLTCQKKQDWILTQSAFSRLLEWLDGGVDSKGVEYLEVRRRLILFFERKCCTDSDELADESLNRVARRLEEEGEIRCKSPAHYCYTVARFVFLESLRKRDRYEAFDDGLSTRTDLNEDEQESERRAECLQRCINKLSPTDRELILTYYKGSQRNKIENRRALAARLGITMNALSIRACRIREKLETCMRNCSS